MIGSTDERMYPAWQKQFAIIFNPEKEIVNPFLAQDKELEKEKMKFCLHVLLPGLNLAILLPDVNWW